MVDPLWSQNNQTESLYSGDYNVSHYWLHVVSKQPNIVIVLDGYRGSWPIMVLKLLVKFGHCILEMLHLLEPVDRVLTHSLRIINMYNCIVWLILFLI